MTGWLCVIPTYEQKLILGHMLGITMSMDKLEPFLGDGY